MTEETLQDTSVAGTVVEEEQGATSLKEPVSGNKTSNLPKKRKTDTFERDIINILKTNVQNSNSQTQDPDEMFLMSQLPIIKALPTAQKMDFQIKFIQLLQSYNYHQSANNNQAQTFSSPSVSSINSSRSTPLNTYHHETNMENLDEESVLSFLDLN